MPFLAFSFSFLCANWWATPQLVSKKKKKKVLDSDASHRLVDFLSRDFFFVPPTQSRRFGPTARHGRPKRQSKGFVCLWGFFFPASHQLVDCFFFISNGRPARHQSTTRAEEGLRGCSANASDLRWERVCVFSCRGLAALPDKKTTGTRALSIPAVPVNTQPYLSRSPHTSAAWLFTDTAA